MRFATENAIQGRPKCPRCGAAMEETASIAPFGADPGLRIFECLRCGSATSYIEAPTPTTKGRVDDAHETVAEGVPTLNSEASCHLADNLAVDQNVNRCLLLETSARDQLAHKWTEFPSADRSHCMRYTSAGGGGTYTDLLTCLEMELHVRDLHIKSTSVANQ